MKDYGDSNELAHDSGNAAYYLSEDAQKPANNKRNVNAARINLCTMSMTVRPRSVTMLPIANIAIPTAFILLILLAGGLIIGGTLLGLVYLFRRFSSGSKERSGR